MFFHRFRTVVFSPLVFYLLIVLFSLYNFTLSGYIHKQETLIKLQTKTIIEKDYEIERLKKEAYLCEHKIPEPTLKYEEARRRAFSDTRYMWKYFKYMWYKLKNNFEGHMTDWNNFYHAMYEFEVSMLSNMRVITENDGYNKWRREELITLNSIVQSRFHYIQNPKDCGHRKMISCASSDKNCGWGCHVHYIVECLSLAYAYNRTLIFNSTGFMYSRKGLGGLLLPFSDTCTKLPVNATRTTKFGNPKNETIYNLYIGQAFYMDDYPPRRVPKELVPRLRKLVGDPMAWWIGQMANYLTKLNPNVQDSINRAKREMKFTHPIVGIHVRKTDKIYQEARSYPIERYMHHVEKYYDVLELSKNISKRRIYLSTDEPKVRIEIQTKYPHYEVLYTRKFQELAHPDARNSEESLKGIISDVQILSSCDFVVCTYSSNVGRLVFEHMQTIHADATDKIISLDSLYSATDDHAKPAIAVRSHVPTNSKEIPLKIGDEVIVFAWNGTQQSIKVHSKRLKKRGYVPGYKLDLLILNIEMPTYPELDRFTLTNSSNFH